ncbi:hypothetical protein [Dactylosporangium sp. NPDC050588]|uniref:hypothetical protein n=1 Tax=Dactylosporangium sp. NPDC050588 TaxID=3157211 RepID=UPI0033C1CB83
MDTPEPAPRSRRGWVDWVTGLAGALTLGALGAGLGGWLAWQVSDDLPADRFALETVQPLVPGTRLHAPDQRHEPPFGYDPPYEGVQALLFGGDDYNGGYIAYHVDPPAQNVTGAIGVAREALVKDHYWKVDTRAPDLPGQAEGVTAVSRHLVVQVYQEGAGGLVLEIGRREPSVVAPLVALFGLVGFALGWVGMRRAVGSGRVAAGTAWAGVGCLAPCTLLTFAVVATMYLAPVTEPIPSWDAYTGIGFRLLANIGVLLLLAATAATVLAERRRRRFPLS